MALIGLLPDRYRGQAGDGSEWSIAKLVEIELGHSLDESPCGGTHRMTALTMAYNRHVAAGGKPTKACGRTRASGSTSASIKPARVPEPRRLAVVELFCPARQVGRPGRVHGLGRAHVMEFLATALDKEELQEPWVKRAVLDVCKLFRKTKPVDVECGALFHAAHGLVLYREKVFGPRTFANWRGEAPG